MTIRQRHRIVEGDCLDIVHRTSGHWTALAGRKLLVTGASSFLGCWFLDALAMAMETYRFECEVTAVGDLAEWGERGAEHLACHPLLKLSEDFDWPSASRHDWYYTIHFLPRARAAAAEEQRRLVEWVASRGPPGRSLLVYDAAEPIDESAVESGLGSSSAPLASRTGPNQSRQSNRTVLVARVFGTVGPYMARGRADYAVAHAPAAADKPGPRRLMYGADAAYWLWSILFSGEPGAIWNVGSHATVDVASLSSAMIGWWHLVSRAAPPAAAQLATGVPDTERTRRALRVDEATSFHDALAKTVAWLSEGRTGQARPESVQFQ